MVDKTSEFRVAIGRKQMNTDSRLTVKGISDNFQCDLCMQIRFSSNILECHCGGRACELCISDWARRKGVN